MKLLKFKYITNLLAIILLIFVVGLFFKQFLVSGKIPISADTIVGMYHPWRDVVWDNLTTGVPFKNFLITDPVRQQYPWRQLVIDLFKTRQLPLWNPYSLAGTPLLANFQSAPFYIFNFLFWIFDFSTAWGLLIFLQPLLAGIFLYLYLSHLRLNKIACLIGAISFAFSGFFIAWLEWGTILHSALWLPLILLSIEKIFAWVEKHKNFQFSIFNFQFVLWGGVFLFSLIQSFFAGHLQTFFYVFLFSFIYLGWRFLAIKEGLPKLIFLFLILYSLFLILTYPQWRPTLEFIRLSARDIDQINWQQPGWFIPWQNLVQFFAPDFFGNPTTLNYWGVFNYGEFIGYIGVIPLIFAFYAIFSPRTRYFILYTLYLILFLSFALPTPWAKLPFKIGIPLFSSSQPTRLLMIVDFCLAILAAFGLDTILKKKEKLTPLVFPALVWGFLWIFIFLAPKVWPNALWVVNLAVSKRNLILPTGMLVVGVGLIVSLFIRWFPKKVTLGLILIFVCFDLIRFGWKFTPFTKQEWIFPSTKTIEFLKSDKSPFRFMNTDRRIFPPNFSVAYRLQTIDGYDPLYLLRYGELIAASERGKPDISPPFGFNRIITPQNYQSPIIDLLNVKYVLSLKEENSAKLVKVFQEGQTRVYENKNVFPRAFMVYDYQLADGQQEVIELMMADKIDLSKTVILEDFPEETHLTEGENEVKITSYQENRVVIRVESDQLGLLVLTDAYFPGWQAEVDGEKTEIYRANYHFRAIIVPKGSHEVVFNYDI